MHHARIAVLALACACAPDTAPALAELAELCGESTPVQVLALAPGEVPPETAARAADLGERSLFAVLTLPEGVDEAGPIALPVAVPMLGLTARIESVDRCGEDHHVVAEGVFEAHAPRGADGPWLGAHALTGQLHWFDAEGRWPARPIARTSTWALLDDRTVVLHRRSDDALVKVALVGAGERVDVDVLAEAVDRVSLVGDAPHTIDDAPIVALGHDGVLALVDPSSGARQMLRAAVVDFVQRRDRRWLAWVEVDAAGARSVWRLDRATGASDVLAAKVPDDIAIRLSADGVELSGPSASGWELRVVSIVSGGTLQLATTWPVVGSGSDGRLVVPTAPGVNRVFAPAGAGFVEVGRIDGRVRGVAGDRALLHDDTPYARIPADIRPYDLVAVSIVTFTREILRRRVWSPVALDHDRWLRIDRADARDPHRLVVVDGDTGAAREVDGDLGERATLVLPVHATPEAPAREAVYFVDDPDSDRHGLWRAAFSE